MKYGEFFKNEKFWDNDLTLLENIVLKNKPDFVAPNSNFIIQYDKLRLMFFENCKYLMFDQFSIDQWRKILKNLTFFHTFWGKIFPHPTIFPRQPKKHEPKDKKKPFWRKISGISITRSSFYQQKRRKFINLFSHISTAAKVQKGCHLAVWVSETNSIMRLWVKYWETHGEKFTPQDFYTLKNDVWHNLGL